MILWKFYSIFIIVCIICVMLGFIQWNYIYDFGSKLLTNKGSRLLDRNKWSSSVTEQTQQFIENSVGVQSYTHFNVTSSLPLESIRSKNNGSLFSPRNKTILLYTPLFQKSYWYGLEENNLQDFMNRAKCEVKLCTITYDIDSTSSADALIFHARDIPNSDYLFDISRDLRRSSQRWIYFTSENPEHTDDPSPYNGLFNWTMTYLSASDLRLPPKLYQPLNKNDIKPKLNSVKRKKLILWISSNCGLIRDEVVFYLQELLPIDVAGGCAHKFDRIVDCYPTNENCTDTMKQYKFYLAFENSICTEYISEKYWRQSLWYDLVPIVLGGGPYENPDLAIPGSYINVQDYPTLEKLADYISYLDQNDTAYNEYFKWKNIYKLWHPVFGDWPYASYWVCELCRMLHEDLPHKVYKELSKFWSLRDSCYMKDAFIHLLLTGKH